MSTLPDVMTVQEAARRLYISERQVWRLLQSGDLEGFKPGRRVVVTSASVSAYLESKPYRTGQEGADEGGEHA